MFANAEDYEAAIERDYAEDAATERKRAVAEARSALNAIQNMTRLVETALFASDRMTPHAAASLAGIRDHAAELRIAVGMPDG